MIIKAKKNKKLLNQNKRNFLINQYYKKRIKNLIKMSKNLLKNNNKNTFLKSELISKFYSIIDKATKKNVIHKNTAARKKMNLTKLLNQ